MSKSEVLVSLPHHAALPLQRRLAEVTEMIHTASLLHDDVIDAADTRRGVSSVNTVFGNKLAVLAGDFLLARASVCLARLRSLPVVELLSTVIEHLVKGEVMQMKTALRSEAATQAAFDLYLRKTYYKTGSLMANSCKAVAMLMRRPDEVCATACTSAWPFSSSTTCSTLRARASRWASSHLPTCARAVSLCCTIASASSKELAPGK